MKKKFNLKNHLEKKSFYEGSQELMRSERKSMDSQKKNLDDGLSLYESWLKWHEEYDKKK
jgi:hypothetical protein